MSKDGRRGSREAAFSVAAHTRSRTARAAIAERLDTAFDGKLPPAPKERYRRPEDLTVPLSNMDRLLERLAEHQVGYHLVAGSEEMLDLMANQIYPKGNLKTLVDNRGVVAQCNLVAGLRQRLLEVTVEAAGGALAPVDAALGITPCEGVIAETGAIVLAADHRTTLQVSLIPGFHFVVAEEKQLVTDLATWMDSHPVDGQHRVLLTGPSRTADIETQVVIGVHGPWKVSLFILRNGWESH
jgi:L-lactate utilization protein LutC